MIRPHDHGPGDAEAWAAHARDRVAAAGHRTGGARSAVITSLADQSCCRSAQEIFDGLKAFRADDGSIRAFRLGDHCRRINISAERLCMPQIDPELLIGAKMMVGVAVHPVFVVVILIQNTVLPGRDNGIILAVAGVDRNRHTLEPVV